MIKHAAVALLMILATDRSADAEAYRCVDAGGRTEYRDSPCSNGEPVTIDTHRSIEAPVGLRASEVEFLMQRERQNAELRQTSPLASPPPAAASKACNGMVMSDIALFSRRLSYTELGADGLPIAQVGTLRCARMRLKLTGYYGRLRDSVAKELQARVIALFFDGELVSATSAKLTGEPRRLGPLEHYSGSFCFGYADDGIADIDCR